VSGTIGDVMTIIAGLVGLIGYGFFAWNQFKKSQHYAEKRKLKKRTKKK